MIAYAAATHGHTNLGAMMSHGWRLMLNAAHPGLWRARHYGFRYALDNGAWVYHQSGGAFDSRAFERSLDELGDRADFILAPDVVAGGLASLYISASWLPRLQGYPGRILIPVQDGMARADLEPYVCARVGLFVGGSTEFKEQTLLMWAEMCRDRGSWCHVGRVNTERRIRMCTAAGVDSIDGSSVTRFGKTITLLDNARRQHGLFT